MTATQVRSDYDQLQNVQKSFSSQSEAVARSTQQIASCMDTLQGGDWIGEGATKFYQEMNDSVIPALNRLQQALAEAARISATISQTMKTAEDEASSVFKIA